jgi:hypothetical protein
MKFLNLPRLGNLLAGGTKPRARKPRLRSQRVLLNVEQLEDRTLPSTTVPYHPLAGGNGVNLQAADVAYHPHSGQSDRVTGRVDVTIPHPQKDQGGFAVRLFWENNLGQLSMASYHDDYEIKSTTPAWGPQTGVGFHFARDNVKAPPSNTQRLIAIVDPDNATPNEVSEKDNAIAVTINLQHNYTEPYNQPTASPQTFVFLLGGWLSNYTPPSGMDKLDQAIRADGRLGNNIYTLNGRGTGPQVNHDASVFIEQHLRLDGYTPSDRVFLVGHSLGGDAARLIATDVSTGFHNAQPAAALVMIDPISFQRVQEDLGNPNVSLSNKLNQSDNRHNQPRPSGVAPSRILDIVQMNSGPEGYHITGLPAQ